MTSISAKEYVKTGPSLDIALLLRIISSEAYWHSTFRLQLPGISPWMIDSLKDLRNRIAHNDGTDLLFNDEQLVVQLLGNMGLILRAANSKNSEEVDALIAMVSPSPRHKLIRLIRGQSRWSIPMGAIAFISLSFAGVLVLYKYSPKVEDQAITIGTADPEIGNYQILKDEMERRIRRKNLKDFIFGKGVEVKVEHARSYPEAIAKIKRLEWQLVFGYSPVVSMTAVETGYKGIGVMFTSKPVYRTIIFSKKTSNYTDLSGVNKSTRIALGDPFSASKYYVPISMLKGKTTTIIENNGTRDIISLVREGKADIGAIAGTPEDFRSRHRDLKIVATSTPLPQSIVAVAPYLNENDRQTIEHVLMSIPASSRKLGAADYGAGKQPDYSGLRRIVEFAKSLSACIQTTSQGSILSCAKDTEIRTYHGWIEDVTPVRNYAILLISAIEGKTIKAEVPKDILKQIAAYRTLNELESKYIRITLKSRLGSTVPISQKISSPNQIEILD